MQELIEQLRSVWFILAFIVFAGIWYADTNSRLTNLEIKVNQNDTLLVDIKERLISIETTLEFIKNK